MSEEKTIDQAVERAAKELPELWSIEIEVMRHGSSVSLYDRSYRPVGYADGETIAEKIHAAVDFATSRAASV